MSKVDGKSFLQRLRFKYKIAILNENTLEEVWRIRMSKLSAIAFSFFLAVVYFFLIAFLIIKTPMRGFLPGYTDNAKLRKSLILTAIQVDSIAEKVQLQSQYLDVLRSVVRGDIKVDSTTTTENLKNVSTDQLLDASENEVAFRDSFESDELMTMRIGIEESSKKNYLMQRPAQGHVVEPFNSHKGVYGLTLSVNQNSSVSSILDGVVVSSEYTLNDIYVMLIQHSDNMMSVYKIRQPYMKKVGDRVHAGEILSTFMKDSDTFFEFQLWKDGAALDPQVFIVF